MKKVLPFIISQIIVFYLIPILIVDTGSGFLILLVLIPFITFLQASLYSLRYKFNILYPIIVGLLFIPSIFIFYNSSAKIYVIIYMVIALLGNSLGLFLRKRKKWKYFILQIHI